MIRRLPHVGLRIIKTAAAVALALFFADLRSSPAPIFAAIGAIAAMSRTWGDAIKTCLTECEGLLAGAGFGLLCVMLFGSMRYVGIAVGLIGLIGLCVRLRLQAAVPLACIVFVSICLSPVDEAFVYSINRLVDTGIGLAVALAINIVVKPYNNRGEIVRLLTHFLQTAPDYVAARVLYGQYPDLSALRAQLARIDTAIDIFEKQAQPRNPLHGEQTVYLRGCAQLAHSVGHALDALCAMDESGRIDPKNAAGLAVLGLEPPPQLIPPGAREADIVGNYHLRQLIDAYRYLCDFIGEAVP